MILTSHILASAVIASKINNPAIGLPAAFLSHFFLDFLPHREYSITGLTKPGSKNFSKSSIKVLADLSLGLGLTIFKLGIQTNFFYLILAIFFSLLPDFLQFFNLINPQQFKKFNHWHSNIIHLKPKSSKIWGWTFQIIFTFFLFFLID